MKWTQGLDLLIWIVFGILLMLLMHRLLHGAPAPKHRPQNVVLPSGAYLVTDGNVLWEDWTLTFHPDGTFTDERNGNVWRGHWAYDKGQLSFVESKGDCLYSVTATLLPDGLRGTYGIGNDSPRTPLRLRWRKAK